VATKKASSPAKSKKSSQTASTETDRGPVPLTLKVDEKTYVRLCTLRAKERTTTQEILSEALQEYLKRVGA
jgi:hypothetical protein